MHVHWVGPVGLLALLALFASALIVLGRMRKSQAIVPVDVVWQPAVETLEQDAPTRIVIGEHPTQPVVTIEVLQAALEYEEAKPLDMQSGSMSRLTALFQAVPSLLVAGEASGKRLMEVVINGDLVRAADGNGLRAFARGAGGIKEHARLYEVSNLQHVINATAIWQAASVVVAQKHLADISQELDEIKDGVLEISRFLDNQRKSRLQSTFDYLEQAYHAIQAGELPESVRHQLEHCERDLLEIQSHLEREFQQKIDSKVEHTEMFGTEDLTAHITQKIDTLHVLVEDMAFCLKVRIIAWHVISLYPGEPQLKLARRASLQQSIESFQTLGSYCEKNVKHKISDIKAFWNWESTLKERRATLVKKCDSTVRTLAHKTQQGREAIARSDQLMLAHDRPTRLLLQVNNGT